MAHNDTTKNGNGAASKQAQLGFESDLFKAADKLRDNMEPSDYKHVALGLIFLKYISDAFEAKRKTLLAEDAQAAAAQGCASAASAGGAGAAEDKDEYLADNVFWVPKEARWSHLQANAKLPAIGTLIDDAMRVIEKDNESLKGARPAGIGATRRCCSRPSRRWSARWSRTTMRASTAPRPSSRWCAGWWWKVSTPRKPR